MAGGRTPIVVDAGLDPGVDAVEAADSSLGAVSVPSASFCLASASAAVINCVHLAGGMRLGWPIGVKLGSRDSGISSRGLDLPPLIA
jgi:hypothetical protein